MFLWEGYHGVDSFTRYIYGVNYYDDTPKFLFPTIPSIGNQIDITSGRRHNEAHIAVSFCRNVRLYTTWTKFLWLESRRLFYLHESHSQPHA